MFIGIVIIYKIPINIEEYNIYNYKFLTLSYFLLGGILLIIFIIKDMDIFEPIVFTSFLYIMIFIISPISDIYNDTTIHFNFNPMNACIKATTIFIFSYISFIIGYYINKKNNIIYKNQDFKENYSSVRIIRLAFLIWIISFILQIIYLRGTGKNLSYILSFGLNGEVNLNDISGSSLGFLSNTTFTMITSWLYIFIYSKNRYIKIIMYLFTMSCLFLRGFRSIIIILILSPIIYIYLRKNKRPKIFAFISVGILIILMIGFVGFARNEVRIGGEIGWNSFNIDIINKSILDNFRRYNIFYGMVNALPEYHSFTLGRNFFYTLIMIIPRAIWPGKPAPVMKEILAVSTNEVIASSGAAWPNIGEFYMEFGILGCLILMFLLGLLLSWTKRLYRGKKISNHSLIAYSVIPPSLITVIAYGYTPSTFYMILFLMLPIIFIQKYSRK